MDKKMFIDSYLRLLKVHHYPKQKAYVVAMALACKDKEEYKANIDRAQSKWIRQKTISLN